MSSAVFHFKTLALPPFQWHNFSSKILLLCSRKVFSPRQIKRGYFMMFKTNRRREKKRWSLSRAFNLTIRTSESQKGCRAPRELPRRGQTAEQDQRHPLKDESFRKGCETRGRQGAAWPLQPLGGRRTNGDSEKELEDILEKKRNSMEARSLQQPTGNETTECGNHPTSAELPLPEMFRKVMLMSFRCLKGNLKYSFFSLPFIIREPQTQEKNVYFFQM